MTESGALALQEDMAVNLTWVRRASSVQVSYRRSFKSRTVTNIKPRANKDCDLMVVGHQSHWQ
ncbi:MAG TPA: hypothetical protein V6C86_26190 [Oculatellaceae cyanobacterium]